MFEQSDINHHIQRSIIGTLMKTEYARFRDLRPQRVDTNLFTYHLKLLQKQGFIVKTEQGYTLDTKGLMYVDRVSAEKVAVRNQPKIITMLLVQNGYGKVLVQNRTKQPYINTWTLPYGKIHIDDTSVIEGAHREAGEKLSYAPEDLRHAGDCYIRVKSDDEILSTTLAHIVRFETDDIEPSEDLQWVSPLKLSKLDCAPAVEQIVARSFFGDEFFFEEFEDEWQR